MRLCRKAPPFDRAAMPSLQMNRDRIRFGGGQPTIFNMAFTLHWHFRPNVIIFYGKTTG